MAILFLAILTLLLLVVVYQDFKSREISWFLIPLLIIVGVANAILTIDLIEFTTYIGVNISLLVLNLIGVTIFISLKEKKLKNIIDSYLGLGDVLFFVVLTTLFSPFNFIGFFIGSILLTSLIYGAIILINKKKQTLIPLAGTMSLFLIVALFLQHFSSTINFYQDFIPFE